MIPEFAWAVFAVHVVLGAAVVALAYKGLETHPAWGWLAGVTGILAVVLGDWLLGKHVLDHYLPVTWPVIEYGTLAAALGGCLGIVATLLVFQPDQPTGPAHAPGAARDDATTPPGTDAVEPDGVEPPR